MAAKNFECYKVVLSVFLCVLAARQIFCLRYDYGDGTFYIGEVTDETGKPNGRGRFYNASGSLEYEGDFYDGEPHGQGTWYGADGSILKGRFVRGRSDGPAILVTKNGDRYEGEFLDRLPHGFIVFVRNPSNINKEDEEQTVTRIEGDFRHGMPHGDVSVWYGLAGIQKTGIRLEGTFRMGRPHGHARVVDYSSGNEEVLFDGKFLNGRPMIESGEADNRELETLLKKVGILSE